MSARRTWIALGSLAGLVGGYLWWKGRQNTARALLPPLTPAVQRLEKAAPSLRLPTSPDLPPTVCRDGSGLLCPRTGRIYPYRDGILDLLEPGSPLSRAQQAFQSPLLAWAYDESREHFVRWTGLPDLATEVALVQRSLRIRPGQCVLDLACGHGVFALEWARRVGPEGLVIGLDLSRSMLERAAEHVRRWDLDNVLLVRGDAHALPLAAGQLDAVHCGCGFHQFPDLPRVMKELARATRAGAPIAASTLARSADDPRASLKTRLEGPLGLRFLDLEALGEAFEAAGFTDYAWHFPRGWFAYTAARKRS